MEKHNVKQLSGSAISFLGVCWTIWSCWAEHWFASADIYPYINIGPSTSVFFRITIIIITMMMPTVIQEDPEKYLYSYTNKSESSSFPLFLTIAASKLWSDDEATLQTRAQTNPFNELGYPKFQSFCQSGILPETKFFFPKFPHDRTPTIQRRRRIRG